MTDRHPSLCRLCINTCPIVVEVDDGRAVGVTGDRDNPVHRGYTCVKGRALPTFLRHPDRLVRSLVRARSGRWEPVPVDEALDGIAARLTDLVERSGPRSVAAYSGTYNVASPATNPLIFAFMEALGSPMVFTPGTIDKPGKSIAAALHGRWMAPPQGFDDPDVLLLLGINPLVTYTGFPYGNPGRWLSDQLRRGMKLIVVDPRRTDVARRAFVHLSPRPGHDAEILAALVRVILDEDLHDAAFVADNVDGVDLLRRAVEPFTPAAVARRADVPADALVLAARTVAAAGRGYTMAGTGPNMSGPGTLIEYLVLALETLCGHWLREGERVRNPGTLVGALRPKAQAAPPGRAHGFGERLRVRGLARSAAGMPTAALADEILLPGDGQVRALISCGGNPAAAWPDQLKTLGALRSLDLLVQVDPWMSQTAELADYVIAPKMGPETPGTSQWHDLLSRFGAGYGQVDAAAQYVPAVVDPPPGSDVIEDWEVFYGLAQRMGLTLDLVPQLGLARERVPLDMARQPSSDELLDLLHTGSRVSLAEVKQHPHGALFPDHSARVAPKDTGWMGRLDVGNAEMMADLAALAPPAASDSASREGARPYRLVCRRMAHVYNSSCNDPATNRGRAYNPAFLHPDDLQGLGAQPGDIVEVASARASILAVAEADPTLRRGLVSMSFGFGGPPERDDEVKTRGTNIERLIPNDVDYDRYSGQPRMSNVPVTVRPTGR